jgi:hypothetical protein
MANEIESQLLVVDLIISSLLNFKMVINTINEDDADLNSALGYLSGAITNVCDFRKKLKDSRYS